MILLFKLIQKTTSASPEKQFLDIRPLASMLTSQFTECRDFFWMYEQHSSGCFYRGA